MSDAPERITVDGTAKVINSTPIFCWNEGAPAVEYVRADLYAALEQERDDCGHCSPRLRTCDSMLRGRTWTG